MHIRPYSANDCQKILDIYSYYVENTAVSFEYEVPKYNDFENRIANIAAKYPVLVAVVNNEAVGFAYANRFRGRKAYDFIAESSVYVNQEVKQKGIGKALYNTLFIELQKMDIKEVIGVVTLPNEESALFHEKLGFKNAGTIKRAGFKFEKWWDIKFYQKSL